VIGDETDTDPGRTGGSAGAGRRRRRSPRRPLVLARRSGSHAAQRAADDGLPRPNTGPRRSPHYRPGDEWIQHPTEPDVHGRSWHYHQPVAAPRRVLVTGSRSWTDTGAIRDALAAVWGDGTRRNGELTCPTGRVRADRRRRGACHRSRRGGRPVRRAACSPTRGKLFPETGGVTAASTKQKTGRE